MRIVSLAILAIVTLAANAPARSQTYDPDFPVCMHVIIFDGGIIEDCRYYTMGQCRASAAGRAGQCDINPYYRRSRGSLGHDPEKWKPVFRKDHAQTNR
jgi:hypothetical protein